MELRRSLAKMGGILSRVVDKLPSCPTLSGWKGSTSLGRGNDGFLDDGRSTGLQLEDYRRLVEDYHEGVSSFRPPVSFPSDLSIVTMKDEEPRLHILTRKVQDARKTVAHLFPRREDAIPTKRTTLYKDLLGRKYDSKLQSLDHESKPTEKISELRKVSKDKLKKDLDGPFIPLTDEEESDINLVFQGQDKYSRRHDALVTHKESNIEITMENIQCLRNGAWLNDEVINLYFELLKEREKREPKKFLRCHFFNTFFYKKLVSGNDGYDFKAVRRWTTQRRIGYGLIECDKIFVPIHREIHWCLAVINIKDKKFQYLDSLGGRDDGVLETLARYFVDEVKDKSNQMINVKSWRHEHACDLPRQKKWVGLRDVHD